MPRPDYLVIGPNPRNSTPPNPGGQLTAMKGLLAYADEVGVTLTFIDTLQGSFPPPPRLIRLMKAFKRQIQLLWYLTFQRPRNGVLIFASGAASFLERGASGTLARLFGVKAAVCLRSGHLAPYLGSSSLVATGISVLLKMQHRVVVQGQSWLPSLEMAGVPLSRIRIVANWVAPGMVTADEPRLAPTGRPIRFIFLGWLVKEKGLFELIEACELLAAEGKPFSLVIAGGGTLLREVKKRVESTRLINFVQVMGWVESDRALRLLLSADVFVLPTHAEGLPNAMVEAFALGLPVIATEVGAIPDSLIDGRNGLLIKPKSSLGIATAMKCYVENPDLIPSHSAAAISTIKEQHDFRKNCRQLLESVIR